MDPLYDPQTGLPGPALFFDRVQQAMHLAQREGMSLAVVVVSIRFSGPDLERPDPERQAIITALAHETTDQVRMSDTVGMIAPDELAILLPNVAPSALPTILQRILDQQPVLVHSQLGDHQLDLRMGMALRPDGCTDVQELMDHAWEGLHRAIGQDGPARAA